MDSICLVALNSQYVHTNLAVRLIKNLDKYDNTHVLEHTINNQMDLVLEDIADKSPKCVIFSCYIWNIEYVKRLVGSLKKILPKTIIALAGPEVSYGCEDILNANPDVDLICNGIGEVTFPQLQDAISSDNLSKVEGICYRQNGKIITHPAFNKFDINKQKFPYYDIEAVKDKILYFETSRGCPFNCSYCISSIQNGVEFMELNKVEQSFEMFFKHNVKQVKLVDRTFNYPVSRAIDIIKIMLELKQKYPNTKTSFHCELNPLLINEEFVNVLSTAPKGFLQFEIGVQSTHPQTLEAINRDVNLKKQHDNILMLTKLENIKVMVDLIAGLPFEDYDTFKKSFNDVYEIKAGGLHLGFLKVLKGSFMQQSAKKHGILHQDHAPYKILKSDYITYSELCYLEKIESLVDTYYNSGNFKNSVNYAVKLFANPFDFYDFFCKYLLDKNYFNRPHKFIYYYDVLFDFLSDIEDANKDYVKDLLLHDYAGNSKPRSYPSFTRNVYSDKKKTSVREFFNNPENIKKYLPNYAHLAPSTISRQCNLELYDYDVTQGEPIKKETCIIYDYTGDISIQKLD